jgi:shikimate kinase/3-dehydroquinate synthase
MAKVRGGQAVGKAAAAAATPKGAKLVFIGFMGAGKSMAARRAGEQLGEEAVDSDSLLEDELGEPIASFFDRHGEAAFREREEALVLKLLEHRGTRVIALGGGAVESVRVRERLAEHLCVYLDVDPELAWKRSQESGRPLARRRDQFLALRGRRVQLYESVARALLPAADTLEQALPAVAKLAERGVPASTRLLWARTETGGYPVYVGPGVLGAAGSLWPDESRCFIVADERVQSLHGERLATSLSERASVPTTVTVPAGERSKTLAEAERVMSALARAGMERSDTLVALGGGVVGDLAGFCAATYQRGVRLAQVPTTLVAQVDSAYGGKTGVDLADAKNYVGAFHQPALVLADPTLLSTLPEEELRAGFSEVLKTALIAGGSLWQRVQELEPLGQEFAREGRPLIETIEGCVQTKLAVVGRDELDLGERASLNLGHTFAHALEAATGYRAYRHGEAVALGLLVTLRLSEHELGLDAFVRERADELLRRHGLPTSFAGPATEKLLDHAALDKKRRGGRLSLVLLHAPGDVAIGCEATEQALRDAIEELRADRAAAR